MENLKALQLKTIAREHKIKGWSFMTKVKLVEALHFININEPMPEANE